LSFIVAESPHEFIASMATVDSVESILEEQAARFQSEQNRMAGLTLQLEAAVDAIQEQVLLQQELIAAQEAKRAQAWSAMMSLTDAQREILNAEPGEYGPVLPLSRPTSGILTSPYGWRDTPSPGLHAGNDYGSPCGSQIRAAADGTVVTAGWSPWFGWYVEIDHGRVGSDYFRTGYAHMTDFVVGVGQPVLRNQLIGFVGNTGESYGCHLHFIVMVNGRMVDGRYYM
jgi:murein DD-endopeptidase MepM/ murein hydrolase activator NlpD